jgi:hypothetical protein
VVLLDEVDDWLRQMMLPRQIGTVLDVRDDDQRAHGRHERFVPVGVLSLILNEVPRFEHLADVVEVCTDAN